MEQIDDTTGSTSIRPETRRLLRQSEIKYLLGVFAKAVEEGSKGIETIGCEFGNVEANTIIRYRCKIDDFIKSINESWPILNRKIEDYINEY